MRHHLGNYKCNNGIFEELSRGVFNTEQVYRLAQKKGLRACKNNFWNIVRNPLYCGKIIIPKYQDEEARSVKGLHEALISEELYYKVQDIIDGRSRKYRPKSKTTDQFPFRGFLTCPDCGKLLTASISKGRAKYYAYYHC